MVIMSPWLSCDYLQAFPLIPEGFLLMQNFRIDEEIHGLVPTTVKHSFHALEVLGLLVVGVVSRQMH